MRVPGLQKLLICIIKLGLCSLTERDVTQIFPLSLHELLALNDQVQQFSIELDGIETGTDLKYAFFRWSSWSICFS